MPTDQLLDNADMDRALRDLLPPMPRSTAWEAHQRDALLTFIQTGDVGAERPGPTVSDAPLVPLRQSRPDGTRSRGVVVLGMAAAAVLLVAGLVIAPRWVSQEVPPAVQPATPDGVAPFPDRYPVLPAGHPMESRVTALWDGQFDWSNEPRSWMIVGRLVDDVVVESIHISSTRMSPAEAGAQLIGSPPAEPVDAIGEGWSLYQDVGSLSDVLVGRLGPATLVIAGADPVATLDAMGGLGFVDASVDSEGEPYLGATILPDGYRVIFGPESLVPGAMSAVLTIPDGEGEPDPTTPNPVGDEGDGISVRIDMNGPFSRQVDGLRRVQIGEAEGWVRLDPGSPVTWKVSETTWATVWDAADTDAALAFARSLEFVDRATWTQRYAVPEPQYPAGRSPAALPTVPSVTVDEMLLPDRFAIVPDDHPLSDQATAHWNGQIAWSNGERASAAVARVVDGVATDGVQLIVYASVDDNTFPLQDSRRMTVAGVEGTLYTERGTPSIRTFVADGSPGLAVQALDPVAFIEAVGRVPIDDVVVDGTMSFRVGSLPDGYSILVPPTRLPLGAVGAVTRIPDPGNGDGLIVFVGLESPLSGLVVVGDVERVDVNGVVGWQQDSGPGSTVIWQVSHTTWAQIGGAMNIEDAIALAQAVEFVDRAIWEERYDVELGTYPTREEWEMIPATTVPSLIALEEIGGLPTDVPISCGSIPPRDELVEVPAVAATPQDALAAFIDTVEPGLWPNGWIHTWNGEDDDSQHRFDYRRDDGQLVTVVYVDAVDGGWAATRWLSTPC